MPQLSVNLDGTIEQIVSDDMIQIDGDREVRRASNVLPLDPMKRIAFVALRKIFGEKGRVSDWTRTWKGPQIVKIVDGPILGPFRDRKTALDREVQWLLKNRL